MVSGWSLIAARNHRNETRFYAVGGQSGMIGELAQKCDLDNAELNEIIEMALSDAASFENIRSLHGLSPDETKALIAAHSNRAATELGASAFASFRIAAKSTSEARLLASMAIMKEPHQRWMTEACRAMQATACSMLQDRLSAR